MKTYTLCLIAGLAATSLQAVTTTWSGGATGIWSTPSNWDTGNAPTSSDNTVIDNATVTINSPSQAAQILLGGTGSSVVTLDVNDYLSYGDTFDNSDWGATGDSITVNINNGGTIDGTGAGLASRIAGDATVNINAGGVLTGIYRTRLDVDFNINGGTFILFGNSNGTQTGIFGLNSNVSLGGSSGTVVLGASGNGVNTSIQSGGASVLDLSNLTVSIEILSGYTPLVGDTFDFHSPAGTYDLGDGTNISSLTYDGGYNITWDTTNWSTQGKLTIDAVSVIPEPSHYAMVAAFAGAVLALRRRKR